jgi:hypothetical protein
VWALPFFTVLAPSERYARQYRLRHKKLTDWARQMLLQTARWLPQRRIVVVADMSYAAIELLNAVCRRVCLIARLRLDARLFEPAPPRSRRTRGRPRVSGRRLPSLAERLDDPKTKWRRVEVTGWYGRTTRALDILSGTAIWHHPGKHAAIRWVLVRDVAGELAPQAFLCTEIDADPVDILRWFVRRWCTEVTFEEVRRHLGVETQRQWSDRAIARTTPALFGLFSLIALRADALQASAPMTPRPASWYSKRLSTFSDALAAVRRELWNAEIFDSSLPSQDAVEIPRTALERLITAACYPARMSKVELSGPHGGRC